MVYPGNHIKVGGFNPYEQVSIDFEGARVMQHYASNHGSVSIGGEHTAKRGIGRWTITSLQTGRAVEVDVVDHDDDGVNHNAVGAGAPVRDVVVSPRIDSRAVIPDRVRVRHEVGISVVLVLVACVLNVWAAAWAVLGGFG